ncbi:helix-turn-helix domain-containing protein [Allobranchiibius sp. GilTou38]|uniref:GlxA family transcriptional regulator n=1 Tax=Allobranchiibius sp. GilTou38 TaxID=2815210 RepID=UPI001AA0B5CB|nr:helix-turn-helix domain-containing protein [Allobranchiibius sp. GilTou38]MBO1766182.1 DJ-1/PfpI family protein [Allobranchiibius sp. GilTou38]
MTRHRMVVLLMDQVLPLDVAIPMHVFAREAPEFYDVRTASLDGSPVAVAGGMHLVPDGDLRLLRRAETVIVPGYGGAATERVAEPGLAALRSAAQRGARMVSICSGTFALAQAGLLDGLTVTTHWSMCADLARQHPSLEVDPNPLFVDNGPILTSGGVTTGVDLALHLLRKDLGPAVATHVAKRIVMAPSREGEQAQFIEMPPIAPGDDYLAAAQQWMLARLGEQITVAQMARRARMSTRTFHRRFAERTSMTPLAWLLQQRIARTKELLEGTGLSVEQIAEQVGLGSPANLRTHFRRETSLAPARYRRVFGGGLGAGEEPHTGAADVPAAVS